MKSAPEMDQELTDDLLVAAIQRGEPEAFRQFLDRHVHHIRGFLALRSPVEHLINELAHETFVFAFSNIRSFKAGTSAAAWLRAIAWNLLRAETKRFSREQANQQRLAALYICELAQNSPEQQVTDEMEFLERCLEQVPAPMRELLALKYHEDYPSKEIAQRLNRSLSWVDTMLFRMRQQLRRCIEQRLRSQQS
jgi:RNA polymerase sigma-70 factor (ECF subfamily)